MSSSSARGGCWDGDSEICFKRDSSSLNSEVDAVKSISNSCFGIDFATFCLSKFLSYKQWLELYCWYLNESKWGKQQRTLNNSLSNDDLERINYFK